MSNTGRKVEERPQRKINQNMKEKAADIVWNCVTASGNISADCLYNAQRYQWKQIQKQVLSQAQQKYESQVLPAKRGDMTRTEILATSNKVYNVILDCKTVNSDRTM